MQTAIYVYQAGFFTTLIMRLLDVGSWIITNCNTNDSTCIQKWGYRDTGHSSIQLRLYRSHVQVSRSLSVVAYIIESSTNTTIQDHKVYLDKLISINPLKTNLHNSFPSNTNGREAVSYLGNALVTTAPRRKQREMTSTKE